MTNNFYADPGGAYDSNVYSFRVDQKISDKNLLFVRVGLTMTNGDTYLGRSQERLRLGQHTEQYPGPERGHFRYPHLQSESGERGEAGLQPHVQRIQDYNFGVDVQSQLGIQGIDNPGNDPAISSMPQFTFGGAIPIAASTGRNQAYTAQNTYQMIDNVSWYKGRHNIKFGVDIRRLQVNNQNKPLNVRGATPSTTASPVLPTRTSCSAGRPAPRAASPGRTHIRAAPTRAFYCRTISNCTRASR